MISLLEIYGCRFYKKMRGADIKNKDIKKLFEETGGDIEGTRQTSRDYISACRGHECGYQE